ncbi:TPR-like protein [Suillus clintonianus]|uniref:TPR-like protein n=1 Tax=Suillus clintonianus TaxID=1904413 RepID=UPI001B873B4A|nr:TPR-like protein [Suillus clintonianus]KAG2129626.1 TPR-like protein [Suillus clintonianus]
MPQPHVLILGQSLGLTAALRLAVKFMGSLSTLRIIFALADLQCTGAAVTASAPMFRQHGIPSDLDEAIKLHRAALDLRPTGHSLRALSLDNLAESLVDRCKQHGIPSDLEEAIELHRTALLLRPPGHSNRPISLNNLASSIEDRFEQRGILSDLDEAIELHRTALHLCPHGHFHRYVSLNNLAVTLIDRFKQQGILSDLDEAVKLHRAALLLCSPGHSNQIMSLHNLANSLVDRCKQRGIPSDLDEAIDLHRTALLLCPPGHSNRSMSLKNLAISLGDRFQQRGITSDLDEAIELHRAALLLRPPGHSDRSVSLNNLAVSLHDRFQQRGITSDLDEAIELHRAALLLHPPGHSDRYMSLNNLAVTLGERFKQRGIPSDLDDAIELHRAALLLHHPGHSDRYMSLNNLARCLRDRFKQRGILSDLDEAIELHRATLFLCPPGHLDRPASLNNLANIIEDRFEQRGIMSDLDEAIKLHRVALLLCPPGHPNRSEFFRNLASSLRARFQTLGIPSDLDEGIKLSQAAILPLPTSWSDQCRSFVNVANSLLDRFKQWGVPSDLDGAITLHRTVLFLYPPVILIDPGLSGVLHMPFTSDFTCHILRSTSLDCLATSLLDRFKQRDVPSDMDEAFGLYLQLSHLPHAASRNDLKAAKSWATFAEEMNDETALVAYQTALKSLDQHVALLSSSSRHFHVVREVTSSLALDAFSCGLRRGTLTTAVELVEQGHAVFWTQLARFRSPLDDLALSYDTGAALAEEFKQLSFRLHQSPQTRQLTMQWDDVVSCIRMLPDFSRFLLPPLFSDLQKAAEDGPVIIVNASQYSCDALIVHSAEDPVRVPLDITQGEVSELSSEFQSLAEQFGSADHQHKLVGILRKLWNCIVHPVVQALMESKVQPRSRIWWCPTAEFTLLPLHAAGPYEKNKDNLSHIFISSYTPTLAALIRARQWVSLDPSTQHFVAIGQANPDGGKGLRCVAPELAVVAECLTPIVSFTSLEDSYATVQGALDALNHNQWIHLACHGMPNRQQPFESSFAMRDGPLMIKDIVQSNWQNPEFAFLSACHTTVGDEKSPDESIHLAAAMQFSGFRSVIGSMWSVDDEVARQVVSAFYRNFIDDSGRLDCTRAAVALHKAVKSLRKKIPLEQQIVFVHIVNSNIDLAVKLLLRELELNKTSGDDSLRTTSSRSFRESSLKVKHGTSAVDLVHAIGDVRGDVDETDKFDYVATHRFTVLSHLERDDIIRKSAMR